jgi:arginase
MSPGWTVLGVPIDSIGAPSSGPPVGTEQSPAALRAHGLVTGLRAHDAGDVETRITGPERDATTGLVGGETVALAVRDVRAATVRVLEEGGRPLLVGGCCTLLMGALAAARDVLGPVGLAYADGHLDLYDHVTSPTGEAADMPIAVLLGHGAPGVLDAVGPSPVLDVARLRLLGARDAQEHADLGDLAARLDVHVTDPDGIRSAPAAAGGVAAQALSRDGGFWLHLDVDVLDELAFPAADYLMPGGLTLDELRALLAPLGSSPRLVGASVACYNPEKDPDGRWGRALTDLLVDVLGDGR